MNERVEQLARDCWSTSEYDTSLDPWFDHRKFAELIMKDVRWVMQTAADDFILDENYDAVKGVGRCMRRVKQHFGVE